MKKKRIVTVFSAFFFFSGCDNFSNPLPNDSTVESTGGKTYTACPPGQMQARARTATKVADML